MRAWPVARSVCERSERADDKLDKDGGRLQGTGGGRRTGDVGFARRAGGRGRAGDGGRVVKLA